MHSPDRKPICSSVSKLYKLVNKQVPSDEAVIILEPQGEN